MTPARRSLPTAAKALVAMLGMQAAVVGAGLTPPILAPVMAAELGVPATLIGYYTSIMIAGAMASALLAAGFVRRFGPVRACQAMLLMAAFGLAALPSGVLAVMVLGAVVLGLSYGGPNTASSQLLMQSTPPAWRARVFSLKQTSMPIGAGAAGLAVPLLQGAVDWRGAALGMSAACVVAAVLAEAWRRELDTGRSANAVLVGRHVLAPLAQVLADPPVRRLIVVAFLFSVVQFSFSTFFVTYVTGTVGIGLVAAGQALSVGMGASIVARLFWGWIADRIGARGAILAMAVGMTAAALLTATFAPGWPLAWVMAVAALFGATAVAWNGVFLAEIARLAPPAQVASVTGGAMFCTFGGALVGPSLFGTLAALAGGPGNAFLVLAGIGAATVVATALPVGRGG